MVGDEVVVVSDRGVVGDVVVVVGESSSCSWSSL